MNDSVHIQHGKLIEPLEKMNLAFDILYTIDEQIVCKRMITGYEMTIPVII